MKTSNNTRAIRAAFCLAVVALSACTPTGNTTSNTIHVDATTQDDSVPSALWLQAEIAGQPLINVFLRDPNVNGDVSIEVAPNAVVKLTAVGTDNDSGVRRIELAGLLSQHKVVNGGWKVQKNLMHTNFGGLTQVPLTIPRDVPKTARFETTIDFGALTQDSDWVVVHLAAVAESGAPPSSNSAAATSGLTLHFLRAGSPPLPPR